MANEQQKRRSTFNSANSGQYPLWPNGYAVQCTKAVSVDAGHNEMPNEANLKKRKQRFYPTTVDIAVLQKHAETMGGFCLSKEYVKSNVHYDWKCSEGHTWKSTWSCVKNGSWCHECRKWQSGRNRRKYNIDDLKKFAQKKGGDCLSAEYSGMEKHYEWKCASNHTWKAKWGNILVGKNWCPYCSSGTGERICRAFFEQLFNAEFPKEKPLWLISEKGTRLELDGYSEKLGIAFEHQGTQHTVDRKHFKDPNYGTGLPTKLAEIQARDATKVVACQNRGILLIQVPSILEELGVENVKSYIRAELLRNHYPLPAGFDNIEVDPDLSYNFNKLLDLKSIIETKGGVLLSDLYMDSKTKYRIKCEKGHIWTSKGDNIKQGKWCKKCAGIDSKTIEDIRKIAESHGGKCLSDNYVNNRAKLKFECKVGHRWLALPANVLNKGSWCKQCAEIKKGVARRKYSIADLQKLAESKGGKCHSNEFTNTKASSVWECSKGHTWSICFEKILQGNWCPHCAGNARKTIQDLHVVARSFGGFCLSEVYTNIKAKYDWKCAMGHEWKTSAERVFKGKWCYQCIKAARKSPGIDFS